MKRHPFSIRLTARQVVNLSLASYLMTLAVLIALRYLGRSIQHGAVPQWAWVVALLVPGLDLVVGLDLLHSTRRLSFARPLLISGVILALFVVWTLWTWR